MPTALRVGGQLLRARLGDRELQLVACDQRPLMKTMGVWLIGLPSRI